MKSRSKMLICTVTSLFLLSACAPYSPIDAKKSGARTESAGSKTPSTQLTDKDIFGNETTVAVSEEDIQAALEGETFHVPRNASIILVQSGSRAPEAAMQQEMSKYYSVATFSGIPDRQKAVSCNKDENGETVTSENMNWMQALRFIAAKGHQKAIIVYQDMLQSGRYDPATKTTVWSDYKDGKLEDSVSLRYLVRFTLVDVASGEWATWSPVNYEFSVPPSPTGTNNPAAGQSPELQLSKLKQTTYVAVVKDLMNRYQ